ncbi:MAG: serine/threonine protein kinase [Myxococcaceae bacterium]|nr:serine/threonine protein kinase [Myxococcaceae bacterium]
MSEVDVTSDRRWASEPQRTVVDPVRAREIELEKLVGKLVAGRYKITRLIGVGGMGAVYEAEHSGIGKKVAIKFVDREHAGEATVASRFAREARAASAIESDHIVTVFDAGTDDERPFIVMELLRGEDLGQRLRRVGKLELSEALRITAQVLRGLADAHEAGIVHRDLKPDNVFLVEKPGDSFVKIVDFGISKIERLGSGTAPLALTGKGTILGTPFYMSPEQAQAFEDVDARTDLYSVGAMLFECLAARPPHVGETYEQIIVSICMTDAPDLRVIDKELPSAVARFVAKALARNRSARFGSARQMLVALMAQINAVPGAPAEPMRASDPLAKSGDPAAQRSSDPDKRTPSGEAAVPARTMLSSGVGDAARATDVGWSSGSRPLVALPPAKRKSSTVLFIATGLAATLAGGLVTFGLATARHGASETEPPVIVAVPTTPAVTAPAVTAPPSIAPLATNVSLTSAGASPTASMKPSGVAPAITTPKSTGASTTGTPTGAAPTTKPTAATKPAAGGKPSGLDIQRDFP